MVVKSGKPRNQWSIGLVLGPTPVGPFRETPAGNPILTAAQVSDVIAHSVADPFLLERDGTWFLFFEIMPESDDRGVIGVADSPDRTSWSYRQVVLAEPFHLSYPYVFAWEGATYMVPETHQAESIRLYRAEDFPSRWSLEAELASGRAFTDASLVHHDGRWWMFASLPSNDTLFLFHAEALSGPWREHPQSPVIVRDASRARPAGRLVHFGGRLVRFAQDDRAGYGQQVRAFEVVELDAARYSEREMAASPVLQPQGETWRARCIHHIDPQQLAPGKWMASVDGQGPLLSTGAAP